jgi:hypothetical protein
LAKGVASKAAREAQTENVTFDPHGSSTSFVFRPEHERRVALVLVRRQSSLLVARSLVSYGPVVAEEFLQAAEYPAKSELVTKPEDRKGEWNSGSSPRRMA